MKLININELEDLLENSDDFKRELSNYVEVIYTDKGFDFIPKNNLKIIDDDGTEIYREFNDLMVKDRRGYLVNRTTQWNLASSSIFKNFGLGGVFNPFKNFIIDIERKNRMKKFYNKKQSGNYSKIIISCGDSWLQHPLNKDIIDIIEEKYEKIAIYCIARAGMELRDVVAEKKYISPLKTEKAEVFIFSAGGNDILGDVSVFTDFYDPKKTPKQHLNNDYYLKLEQLKYWYKEVFGNINMYSKYISKIIVHGYDVPIPVVNGDGRSGKWIGSNLASKRNIKNFDFQLKIANEVINDIYNILFEVSLLPEFSGKVKLLDFRGTFNDVSDWFDEIHPNKSSNEILAELIYKEF